MSGVHFRASSFLQNFPKDLQTRSFSFQALIGVGHPAHIAADQHVAVRPGGWHILPNLRQPSSCRTTGHLGDVWCLDTQTPVKSSESQVSPLVTQTLIINLMKVMNMWSWVICTRKVNLIIQWKQHETMHNEETHTKNKKDTSSAIAGHFA